MYKSAHAVRFGTLTAACAFLAKTRAFALTISSSTPRLASALASQIAARMKMKFGTTLLANACPLRAPRRSLYATI